MTPHNETDLLLLFSTKGKPGAPGSPGNKGEKGDMVIPRVKGEPSWSLNCHLMN